MTEKEKIIEELKKHLLTEMACTRSEFKDFLKSKYPIIIEHLILILTQPKHALLKQYKEEFRLDGIDFDIEEGALPKIAQRAKERKMGARALRTVMEDILFETKFSVPGDPTVKKVVIKEDLTVDILREGVEEEKAAE